MKTHFFDFKSRIKEVFIALYSKNQQPPSVEAICRKLDLDNDDFQLFFDTETRVLENIYVDYVNQYKLMIPVVEGFSESSLEEKLSNFIYVMFGIFEKDREFVQASFENINSQGSLNSPFYRTIEDVLKVIIGSCGSPGNEDAAPRKVVLQGHYGRYHQDILRYINLQLIINSYSELIKYWLEDDSHYFEKTAIYADQLAAFWANTIQMSSAVAQDHSEFANVS